jgi:hypothetical protein
VFGPVVAAQDQELRIARDGDTAQDAGTGMHDRRGADAPSQLLPQDGRAELRPDRGHGLLLGLPA